MNQQPEFSTPLRASMQQQLELITKYIEYLGRIKQVISQGKADQLNQLLGHQPFDIALIDNCRQQHLNLLAQHGYSGSDQGLKHYIEESNDAGIKALYLALVEQIRQLEKSLLINDLLIRKNQHRVRQTLKILSGHNLSDNATTYSREGGTDQLENSKRSLAQA